MSTPLLDPAQTSATGTPQPPAEPTHDDPDKQEIDWKAQSRLWESRAKANNAAVKKLQEIEDAGKTETQKTADEIAALKAQIKAFETKAQLDEWKTQVAKDSGVPADILAGSTLEELQAHAAKLKPLLAAQPFVPPVDGEGKTPQQPSSGDWLRASLGR